MEITVLRSHPDLKECCVTAVRSVEQLDWSQELPRLPSDRALQGRSATTNNLLQRLVEHMHFLWAARAGDAVREVALTSVVVTGATADIGSQTSSESSHRVLTGSVSSQTHPDLPAGEVMIGPSFFRCPSNVWRTLVYFNVCYIHSDRYGGKPVFFYSASCLTRFTGSADSSPVGRNACSRFGIICPDYRTIAVSKIVLHGHTKSGHANAQIYG